MSDNTDIPPLSGSNMDRDSSSEAATIFADMHSGGCQKLDFAYLAVNLPESKAVAWFEETYNRDPHHVTCECCGADYSLSEFSSIKEALEYYPLARVVLL